MAHFEFKRTIEENRKLQFLKTKFLNVMNNDINDSLLGVKGIGKFLVQDLENDEQSKDINEIVNKSIKNFEKDIKVENVKFILN